MLQTCVQSDGEGAVPYGLGWTHRLLKQPAGGELTLRELYVRRLTLGLAGAGVGFSLLAGPLFLFFGSVAAMALFFVAAGLYGGLLAAFLRKPDGFATWVHCGMAVNVIVTALVSVATGGIGAGFNPAWLLVSPVFTMLVLGRRPALVWLGLSLMTAVAIVGWQELNSPAGGPQLYTPYTLYSELVSLTMFGSVLLLTLVWFVEQRDLAEQTTDRLLYDLLPRPIAERLKHGELVADHHPSISVLFADLVGFTPLSAELAPEALVKLLDELFRELDGLVARRGLEKIKTIGDCYMVASGVPSARADHARVLAHLALEFRDLVERRTFAGRKLALRIGMHSGPVVAGVIGEQRFLYDLWGDTVNVASRMESSGAPGRILVTDEVAEALRADFELEERGIVDVKGRGEMRCWWLLGALSAEPSVEASEPDIRTA